MHGQTTLNVMLTELQLLGSTEYPANVNKFLNSYSMNLYLLWDSFNAKFNGTTVTTPVLAFSCGYC